MDKKNSSHGANSSGFPLRQSADFRKATATFPDKSSIDEYVYDSKLGSTDMAQRPDNPTHVQRISVSKLADIEHEMQLSKHKYENNFSGTLDHN